MKNETNMTNLIKLENVSRTFGANSRETLVLDSISLEAVRGELLLLLGPSGSGKTTLLTLIAGLIKPTSGKVSLFDKDISQYSYQELQAIRAKHIGFIFQTFKLIDSFTVEENITIVGRFAGLRDKESKDRTDQLLNQLKINHLAKKLPSQLSQGEKQRTAIARATLVNTDIIIADEPTASLEANQGYQIIELLHHYAEEQNKLVIVASHDLRLKKFTNKIMYIENGKMLN